MMLIDADNWLMLIDFDWFWLMLIDADWCWLMLIDAIGCWLILKDVREWHKLERTHIPWLSIFKCKSISSTYPGESVGRDGEGGLWSIPCFMHLLKLCKFLLWRSVWEELGNPQWGWQIHLLRKLILDQWMQFSLFDAQIQFSLFDAQIQLCNEGVLPRATSPQEQGAKCRAEECLQNSLVAANFNWQRRFI